MTNIGTLYGYELRKILRRKIVWISTAIILIMIFITVISPLLGAYYLDDVKIDTHYHMFQMDKAYEQRLNNRLINQSLLEEMKVGYDKIPSDVQHYTDNEEYQTYARPYSAIFNFVRGMTDMTVAEAMQWTPDEQDMYRRRQVMLEESWKSNSLSQDEKDFWKVQEEKIEWPIRFHYKEGYWRLFASLYTIGLMTLIIITICLSTVFTEEHTKKTDQLILSSKHGRETIYWSKLLAGVSFSLMVSIAFSSIAFIIAFAAFGSEGFSSAFQLMWGEYSYPLSTGEASLISYGMMIIASVITGVFVMALSELLHSSIGTLSLVLGLIILPMFFSMPEQYRVLSQLWSYLPSEFVAIWSIFSPQLIQVWGKYYMAWQVVPVLYIILSGVFALIGKMAYTRYQVNGR